MRFSLAVPVVILMLPSPAPAQTVPGYGEAESALESAWKERYPIAYEQSKANPQSLGALRVISEGRFVYYYQFQVVVPRPFRAEGNDEMQAEENRAVECWLRYRSWLPAEERWDVSFVRQDRLPGTQRRWIQVGQ